MSHLFVDESKARGYTLVAVTVNSTTINTLRRQMRSLVLPGQRRIHFTKERDERKRLILSRLTSYEVQAQVFHCKTKNSATGRERCLASLVTYAAQQECTKIVLERDESIAQSDRRILYREVNYHGLSPSLTYSIEAPHAEPLLWAADAIAWSQAKGNDWKRRSDPLIIGVTSVPE